MSTNLATSRRKIVANYWVVKQVRANEKIADVRIFFVCGLSLRFMVLAASYTPPCPWDFITPMPNAPLCSQDESNFHTALFLNLPSHPGIEREQRPQTFTVWLPSCARAAHEIKTHATVRWAAATYERLLNLPGNITQCVTVWMDWYFDVNWLLVCVTARETTGQIKGSGASCLCAVCMFSMCLSTWAPSGCSDVTLLSKHA